MAQKICNTIDIGAYSLDKACEEFSRLTCAGDRSREEINELTSQLNSKIYELATNKRLHDSTVDLDVKLLKMQLPDANVEIAKQRATIRDLEIKINESDAYLNKAVNFETELSLAID